MKNYLIICVLVFFGISSASAQFLAGNKNLKTYTGFFDFHYSEVEGSNYLEVPKQRIDQEFLYVHSLRTGLGSNDIGLDRGQLGAGVVVKFIKSGNKLLLLQPNLDYRAITENRAERKSIEEAFAKSVLYAFDIKETRGEEYIIDLTPFLFLDAHGVANKLKKGKYGTYKQDKSRNTLWLERTKSFPKNTEFEAMITFVGEPKGKNIQSVAPDAKSISVIQHHSFVELPDSGYKARAFDPRSGSISMSYMDYSTPIWEPIKKRVIARHRLEKKDPTAALSAAVEPIIYYLDPGTPEPVRSALLEGASWWNQAYEAIGYKDAFQVKMLPEDADPMDVRYNTIQWVHRSTRGWSYGSTVSDPRTGEIIKGHVSLGSLRIRQDFMIAQALMNKPFIEPDDNYQPMLDMALARIRQLSAHEVGHTIGFAHNFAASTNDRASVMDYPHPTLKLANGQIDFSDAYAIGIGDWDKVTVAYSYGDAPVNTDEKVYLDRVLTEAQAKGLRFITDSDARAQSGAHGKAHLWDNGANAAQELEDLLKLRKVAIANFSEDNIRKGDPYTVLEDVFVPLYFYHRFQTEAAVKLIGGMDYNYAVKGDGQLIHEPIPYLEQAHALDAVLKTMKPQHLAIPKEKLELFPPRAFGYLRSRESFKSDTGVAFDALGAVATASNMTLELLLNPERANRLIQQKSMDPNTLGFRAMLQEIFDTAGLIRRGKGDLSYVAEVDRTIGYVTLQRVFYLLSHKKTSFQVNAIVNSELDILINNFKKGDDFQKQLLREIQDFRKAPEKFTMITTPKIPDGSPIGSFQCYVSMDDD